MSGTHVDVNHHFDLNTWPLWTPHQASHEPLGETIRVMKSSGLRRLGFAIFRGTCNDQDALDRLVARIRQNAFDYLDIRQELLGQLLDFPVLRSDSEKGQGTAMSLGEAHAAFRQWSRNAASDYNNLPRFHYFIYVDETCLDGKRGRPRIRKSPTCGLGDLRALSSWYGQNKSDPSKEEA